MAALQTEAASGEGATVPWPPFVTPMLGVENLTVSKLLDYLCRELPSPPPDPSAGPAGRVLDTCVEAQVHGRIDLQRDVERLVIDPAFEGTPTGEILNKVCRRYEIPNQWHCGFQLPVQAVPDDFRGPAMQRLAQRIASDGMLDAGNRQLTDGQIPTLRAKWANLSAYVKEIKQSFSRWYNKRHERKGFFWGERFKSVLVDNGDTLVNCLAYIDLNPVRAGLTERPEDYRWCSLAYHVQTGNKDDFLSLDFGLTVFSKQDATTRLHSYRRYVYENGAQPAMQGVRLDPQLVDKEAKKGFALTPVDRLRYRTRYFTDSGVIGTKAFVSRCAQMFEHHFSSRHTKRPQPIAGLPGVYALKRLSEAR